MEGGVGKEENVKIVKVMESEHELVPAFLLLCRGWAFVSTGAIMFLITAVLFLLLPTGALCTTRHLNWLSSIDICECHTPHAGGVWEIYIHTYAVI